MGLIDRMFSGRDPAKEWSRTDGLSLQVDLTDSSFCGIRLGDPVDRISKLGAPVNSRPTREGAYEYSSEGFEIDASDGRIDGICIFWDDPDGARFGAFAGSFIHQGRFVDLGPATLEPQFEERFGPPYWRVEDDDEIILFYEGDEIEWQVEFRKDRTLKCLLMVTPPLLADEGQRRASGVTKAWPPA